MEASAESLRPRRAADLRGTLAALRAGDANALALVYREYAPELLAVAFRLTMSRADAEDVVHDLFVGLPEALRHYEERGTFAAWLKRVAVRLALSRLRAPSAREIGLDEGPERVAPSRDAIAGIAIADAMASLSPSLRGVVVLKEIEGYSHAEIGSMLGISTAASEVRLHRALRALRAALREE